jgi:ribosomal protein S8
MKLFFNLICIQNNTRNNVFTIYKNNYVVNICKKLESQGYLKILEITDREITCKKNKKYKITRIRRILPETYFSCVKIIVRKLDKSGVRELFFTTSQGILTSKELNEKKIGGVPLFILENER